MSLAFLLILTGANFGIAAVYLCTRNIRYPFWVYAAAALLCWWPLAIFPVLFCAETRMQTEASAKTAAGNKLRLASFVLVCSVALQGFASIALRQILPNDSASDAASLFCAAASLAIMLILIYSLYICDKISTK